MSTAEVRGLIDYIVDHDFLELLLEGAEPFCRPDIYDILNYATTRLAMSLTTNGTLVDAEVAVRIADAGVSAVFVSLHGPEPRSHEAATTAPGSFLATIRGIEALVRAGVTVVVYTPVVRQNITVLNQLVCFARDMGVRSVNFVGLHRLGRASSYWDDIAPRKEELRDAIRGIVPVRGVRISHRYFPQIHNCCTQACTVTSSGDVIGCLYLRGAAHYGNIRQSSLLDLWNSETWRRRRYMRIRGKCRDCGSASNCGGGCRASSLEVTGSWAEPDPFCWRDCFVSEDSWGEDTLENTGLPGHEP